jgi:periplasmic protein TonB
MLPQSPSRSSKNSPAAGGAARSRRPFVERRDLERRESRRRVAARVTSALDEKQNDFDPLSHADRAPRRRAVMFAIALGASLAAHVLVIGGGLGWRLVSPPAPVHDEVKIEVRERPPEKKPEPPPPPPAAEKIPPPPPRVVRPALPPPEAPPPKEPPKTPPVRIIGLSLESTTAGGEGPGFAVGNTRMGDTDKKAVAPSSVKPATIEATPLAAPSGPATVNQVASRIPSLGVKYGLPRRRNKKEPPYPVTLESQGIEADVTVMVSIDDHGKVTGVKLIKEAPYPEFNEAARTTALAEEFEPATRDGVPIPYSLSFTYRFRLKEQ